MQPVNSRGKAYQPPPPPGQGGGAGRNSRIPAIPRRWYHSTAVVIVCLVVLFPLGLALLWTSPFVTRRMKIIASSIVGAVALLVLLLVLILLLRGGAGAKSPTPAVPPMTSSPSTSALVTTTTTTSTTSTTTTTPAGPGGTGSSTTQQNTIPLPNPSSEDSYVYFPTCAAARAAGVAPLHIGEPGYRLGLDRDKDGKACE
jgi:hypothetical protein